MKEKEEDNMTVERYLRLIAGVFVMSTLLLGLYHNQAWFFMTGFVALNLMQSAFTNWCPMMTLLRKLGVKDAVPCVPAQSSVIDEHTGAHHDGRSPVHPVPQV
jgi:hypothetical protein